MANAKFTLKNYFKELKKSWLLLAIFVVLGAAGGAFYAFRKPVLYTATAKVVINNASVDNGSMTSPYAQITALLMSKDLVNQAKGEDVNIPSYTVVEAPRGVFAVTATDADEQRAKDGANTVIDNVDKIIALAFDNARDFRVTVVERAENTTPTVTMKTRIISIVVAAAAMFVLAAVVVFVKFDYRSEK
jgi:capsular polysaccharide biosynthesis protein